MRINSSKINGFRFSMFQTEMLVGQIGFAENLVYPTNFGGSDGSRGLHPAAPYLGDSSKILKKII